MLVQGQHISQNEQLLLAKLKMGNELAFEEIYRLYSSKIYGKLLRLLKDVDTADSILQDVFLRVWDHRQQIDVDLSFRSYLYKIAENLVYDHFRKMARDAKMCNKLRQITTEVCSSGEDELFRKENNILISEAIKKLPPQRKIVFELCKIEGKTYEEASQLLGISTSTVSNQLVKATRSVKEHVLLYSGMTITAILLIIITSH